MTAGPCIHAAITAHGFGHAARTCAVLRRVRELAPDTRITIGTGAPAWLVETYLGHDVKIVDQQLDVGVVQADAITIDRELTIQRLDEIHRDEATLVAATARFLHDHDVDLVVGDVPPLAIDAAHAAGVECVMVSNFGWDFNYRAWLDDIEEPHHSTLRNQIEWIEASQSRADLLLRLPFHEPMSSFGPTVDVGLTGGSPTIGETELRARLGLTTDTRPIVVITFGGLGLDHVPWKALERHDDHHFVTFDHQAAPDVANLTRVSDHSIRPVDVMGIAERLITKPGYGTIAEAIMVGLPIVLVDRPGYPEAALLVEGARAMSPHRVIDTSVLRDGEWSFVVDPVRPPMGEAPALDGKDQVAKALLARIE